jgi:hypothetical protein
VPWPVSMDILCEDANTLVGGENIVSYLGSLPSTTNRATAAVRVRGCPHVAGAMRVCIGNGWCCDLPCGLFRAGVVPSSLPCQVLPVPELLTILELVFCAQAALPASRPFGWAALGKASTLGVGSVKRKILKNKLKKAEAKSGKGPRMFLDSGTYIICKAGPSQCLQPDCKLWIQAC